MGGINISFSEWQNFDVFTREAVKSVANKIFNEQKKEANKIRQDMESKLESSKEYQSPFNGIPKPSFFQQ